MIEGTMDDLVAQSMDKFRDLMQFNSRERRWKGLILTGSEITLFRELPELARMARESGFEHVRIQTHGMKLARQDYCDLLVDAGVDEFFVSVTGCDAESHDSITMVEGSFDKTLAGLENLDQYDHVTTITNSVITSESYMLLPGLVENLGHIRRLRQMEFWIYWPMKETDEKNLIPKVSEILPYLKDSTDRARQLGRSVEIKNFPQCLLGDDAGLLLNDQPMLYIDPDFWNEFERNGFYQCVHREQCGSEQCLGLSSAYIRKYGWEENLLHPV
jgi:MoaA/NifB/PqqE/SkfB family radical SAM enzyme